MKNSETKDFIKFTQNSDYSGKNPGYSGKNPRYSAEKPLKESKVEESRVNKSNISASRREGGTGVSVKHRYGEYKNVLLSDSELKKLNESYSNVDELIRYLDEYIEMKGYKAKSHYLCIKKWVTDAVKSRAGRDSESDIYTDNLNHDELELLTRRAG